ncbi:MAG: SpoIIE family protein phosphatase [Lachnospiraceae bacterium]|nr:SpoIIE family protein phosphatase [Lachnospiraceae bacterium]
MPFIIPVIVNLVLVVVLYAADKKTAFKHAHPIAKQVIIGIIFGLMAAFASRFGIAHDDMIVNIRDAAPLSAGLIFGGPAGAIAGVIGALDRYLFVTGDFTRIACALATLLAGLIAALLRHLMFDDKKPNLVYGIGIALVCEDIHMLLIFLLNLKRSTEAFSFVQRAAIPMIIGNGVALGLAILAVTLMSREKVRLRGQKGNITETFQRWLMICIVIAYFITSLFTYRLQSNMAETQTSVVINQTIADVYQDIMDTSDTHLLAKTEKIMTVYTSKPSWTSDQLRELAISNGVIGIHIFGEDGIITESSRPDFLGFDMNSGDQSREFMCLFQGEDYYVQPYQPISATPSVSRKFAAIRMPGGKAIQVGYSYAQYKSALDDEIYIATRNRHIGRNGFIMIADENWKIVADGEEHNGMNLARLGIWIDKDTMTEGKIYKANFEGKPHLFSFSFSEGYGIVGGIPETEANIMRDASIYISILIQVLIFATLFVVVYVLVKVTIINNLRKINASLEQITGGNLNTTVNVRSSAEFASLSDDINSTVDTLKRYIAEAASRLDKELEYAKQIQYSALPSTFPPFPGDHRFDIFARMDTAKEVGGDFYDFYLLDKNTVAFLAADVSGKGIPASLFMMRAKTTVKDLAEQGLPVNTILAEANDKLCEGNEAGMFVTLLMGIVDLTTGEIRLANAGHNPPLVRHKDGSFEYLKLKPGLVLAGMEGIPYRMHSMNLEAGDRFFTYTDGVTEATNANNELYGEDRLLNFMNQHTDLPAKELLAALKADIDAFVGEAPQFDDITMLMFDYFGGEE